MPNTLTYVLQLYWKISCQDKKRKGYVIDVKWYQIRKKSNIKK